ncbi:MAG: YjbH domain-containing protein [Micavibrio sp.]
MIRVTLIIALLCGATPAFAGDRASVSLLGPLGLNTVPSARMDPAGTLRAGVATSDPYAHAYFSVQTADSLNITLRQTAEISGLNEDAKRLYPGVDLKLRILEEKKYLPEISIGLMSAIGHKRMAGEYLALSKRYKNFSFTGGLGWGRLGSSENFKNPLRFLSHHFEKNRALDGEMPNGPEDWFTGGDVGVFGGVEYFTPLKGLSLKADWNADRYRAETSASDFDSPDPWSVGINYAPTGWVDFGVGVNGGDKIMATLSLKNTLEKWRGRKNEKTDPAPLRPERTDLTRTGQMAFDAARYGSTILYDIRRTVNSVWAKLDAEPGQALPQQIGRAARNMANHAGAGIEELLITPHVIGLDGPSLRLMRRDLEQALVHHQGSPQEIWRNALMNAPIPDDLENSVVDIDHFGFGSRERSLPRLKFILDTQISLSEEDNGILYRTSVILDGLHQISRHWVIGGGLRLNGPDNLSDLVNIRPAAFYPVRSDVARFAGKTVTLDRLYNAYLRSFGDGDWHVMAAGGYLEEMYSGFGGEVLYRPFGKTYAFGAELWQTFRRAPDSRLAMALNGDHVLSGHLKAWYEIPRTDLTLGIRAGRYLAQDLGGTLSLTKTMNNGATIEAFATATDQADFDLFGGTTHLYSGLRLTLPLGNVPLLPDGSHAKIAAAPLGRDIGQTLDSPLPLYALTEPFSYRSLAQNWESVID